MSINILSLNATIYNKLNEEFELSGKQVSLITNILSDSELTEECQKDLKAIRSKLIENQNTDKVEFLQKTHSLINEYIKIINIPLCSTEDNQKVLQKKQITMATSSANPSRMMVRPSCLAPNSKKVGTSSTPEAAHVMKAIPSHSSKNFPPGPGSEMEKITSFPRKVHSPSPV